MRSAAVEACTALGKSLAGYSTALDRQAVDAAARLSGCGVWVCEAGQEGQCTARWVMSRGRLCMQGRAWKLGGKVGHAL